MRERCKVNSNGFARGLMAKNSNEEEFIKHVASVVERQLKEWDEKYEVMVIKGVHYEFVVNHNDDFYHLQLSQQDIHELQKRSPYALDRKIWQELEKIGLTIRWDRGNYIEVVLK
jgi:ribosomal protein S19E (S16A)